ncbi:hypothetical protein N7513_010358 [Penicillium frequentans]|nr:hypothetical protein N7513_010358 [Penicillium glabrum]
MSLISLPLDVLLPITHYLRPNEINALLQSHSRLYRALNDEFYFDHVRNHDASAIFWAASTGSMVTLQRLIDAGANIQRDPAYEWIKPRFERKRQPAHKKHPISYAAINGHVNIVAKLLDLGVNIDYQDLDGRSPLSLAVREGHFELVQMLVANGADLLSLDVDGLYPMENTSSRVPEEVEDWLFEKVQEFVDTKRVSESDMILKRHLQWMLRCAAERGDEDRVRYFLMQDGVDINFVPLQQDLVPPAGTHQPTPWRSYTPLIAALQSAPDPIRMARMLLENGADPNMIIAIKDPRPTSRDFGSTYFGLYENPASAALGRDESYSLIELLLHYGLNQSNSELTLVKATYLKKTDEFRLLLENGAYYHGPLRKITDFGYQPIIDLLVERGIMSRPQTPKTDEEIIAEFDFDALLNPGPESDGVGVSVYVREEPMPRAVMPRAVTPVPRTKAPWAFYLSFNLMRYQS